MTDEVLVRVEHVSKKFCRSLKQSLWYGLQDAATELTGHKSDHELRKDEFWALKDVSFELRRGEALGLVGANGAGKTTLLRIIAGLIKPDRGSVEIHGRVAPLIALGAGVNPILTGRENIYVNMSILGLSQAEIDQRFETVVEFADIGDAIDAPVQTYSSGMAARLGFASAAFTNADLLLVDEVLAVGDLQFRAKCTRRIAELRNRGITIIFVSHTPSLVLSVCDQAVYLSRGQVLMSGKTKAIIERYEADLFGSNVAVHPGKLELSGNLNSSDSDLRMTYIALKDDQGRIVATPQTGQAVTLCIGCESKQYFDNCIIPSICFEDLTIGKGSGDPTILGFGPHHEGQSLTLPRGLSEIQVRLDPFVLRPGQYGIRIWMNKLPLPNGLDVCHDFKIEVKPPSFDLPRDLNLFFQPRTWEVVTS